ncbi:MAG: hypothetical protein HYX46_01920 [Betaproteobacteria bacterium]|nr:hypothetical protein [Betaproteobacteria bacterium]
MKALALLLLAGATAASFAPAVYAHAGERAFVLLLPTGLYIFGGALAVAFSFAVMACLPSRHFSRLAEFRLPLATISRWTSVLPSAAVLLALALCVVAGFVASRDPLDNPLPLVIWTLWWVGFTFLTALAGNLWELFHPWRAAHHLATALPGLARFRAVSPLAYPAWLQYWPAVLLLLAFAWFELIYPAPHDPAILAIAVIAYAAITLAGMLLFGGEPWLHRAEAFSVFFRMVAWLSPLALKSPQPGERERLELSFGLPCRGLFAAGPLPASGVVFVLVALASVSFDGLSRTFWWIGLIGENPLEHPGRSSLVVVNTLGLVATAAALAGAFLAAVRLGGGLAERGRGAEGGYGHYVLAIVPIAFGYHFAHYLPTFPVDAQYAVRALGDPFSLGWNLLGARELYVTTSFLSHHASVHAIWNVQVAGIVAAHVAAVFVAHVLALRHHVSVRAALLSQLPMTALMVAYTIFGLWLLATPVAA